MKRTIRFSMLILFILCVAQLTYAQTPDRSGRWAGTLTLNGTANGMELTLSRENTTWNSSLKLRVGGQEVTPSVINLAINDNVVSFSIAVSGRTAKFNGKFEGEILTGTMESFQGEQRVSSGTFALTRGGEMPPPPANTGQRADPNFDARVAKPAYKKNGPRVLFDEAHNNFHTAGGRYKPFADLIVSDGYRVTPNKEKFSTDVLKNADLLIISNAIGSTDMDSPEASTPAFTDAESDAVKEWVSAGGSLLLIADHAPMGSANQILGKRFGVDMSKKYTIDKENFEKASGNQGFIVYTRESGRLADHPVTKGRDKNERINKVIAFTGQSLKGPADSFAFMRLADSAQDVMGQEAPVSAAGRAQGIALKFGKGRVIVMGEAGMLTAQVVGPEASPFGMNIPGIDNRQLILNMIHWLTRKL
jgi:hypothetical protein